MNRLWLSILIAPYILFACDNANAQQEPSGTYPVVDTGIVNFYSDTSVIPAPSEGEAFYGQDAHYQGYSPSYTDNGDGAVSDNVTGLMWQQDMGVKMTFDEAITAANELVLGGFDDWRVPTIKELYSLILFSGVNGDGSNEDTYVLFIDSDYFNQPFGDQSGGGRIIDAQTWSSAEYVGKTMNGDDTVFGVNFIDGRIKGYPKYKPGPIKVANTMYFRFVRGNTAYGINEFVDNSDGTVTDSATGLMWQQADDGSGRDWEDALAYAESLELAGYDDWRLPNAKELHSIVDYSRSPQTSNSPAIDPIFSTTEITDPEGNSGQYPYFWTSTIHIDGINHYDTAVYIAFGEAQGQMNNQLMDVHGAGAQRSDPKTGNPNDYPAYWGPQGDVRYVFNYVRLVRTVSVADTSSIDDPPDSGGNKVTLFAPIGSTSTYLIDANSDVIKTWESSSRPSLSAYLLDDKSLLRTASLGLDGNSVFNSGSGGRVERFDWDGNKIWEFEYSSDNYMRHHDIEYLPNGNILMIAWEYKSEAEAIEAGRNPSLLTDGALWPDTIIEVKPEGSSGGTIVWEWHVWDHLIQDYDAAKSNYGTLSDNPGKIDINYVLNRPIADWTHINAVDYNAGLDQIVLTAHNFSEIWLIDHNTTTVEAAGSAGDLIYRWGNPQAYDRGSSADQQLFVPHDGHWIESASPGEGDILIFNNGMNRPDGNYSSIEQIKAPEDGNGGYILDSGTAFGPAAPGWSWSADPPSSFYADQISGAQRLPDGNTLICNGPTGTFFEVTAEGAKVWEYVNPMVYNTPQGESANSVFRAVRYNLDNLDSGGGDNGQSSIEAPTDVTVTDTADDQGHSVIVSWNLSTDDESLTHYSVFRSRNPVLTERILLSSIASLEDLIKTEQDSTIMIATVERGVGIYTDNAIPVNGVTYYYWIQATGETGVSEKVSAGSIFTTAIEDIPQNSRIDAPYPNPFNPTTTIRYEVSSKTHVNLVIYDILGREVRVLENRIVSPGTHEAVWNGYDKNGDLSGSGIYLYKFSAGTFMHKGKVILLR